MREQTLSRVLMHLATAAPQDVALPRVLREVVGDERDWQVRKAVVQIADALDQGKTVSDALAKTETPLPPHLLALIRHGEASGNLSDLVSAFVRLHGGLDRLQTRLWKPLNLLALVPGVAAGFVLLLGVSGAMTYQGAYAAIGYELPSLAQLLASLGSGILSLSVAGSAATMVFVVVLAFGVSWYATDLLIRRNVDRLPVIRSVFAIASEFYLVECLDVLLGAGLPLRDAVALVAKVVPSTQHRRVLEELATGLEHGREPADLLRGEPGASALLREALVLGIQEGNLTSHLDNVRRAHQEFLDHRVPEIAETTAYAAYGMVAVLIGAGTALFYLVHFGIGALGG